MSKSIILLHGFASSAQGTKGTYLNQQFAHFPGVAFYAFDFNPTPLDFEYMTVTGMINRLRQFILDRQPEALSLIGSSMGGLVGLNYAHRFGQVDRLLLLAPALTYLPGQHSQSEAQTWREKGTTQMLHYGFGRSVPMRYDLEVDGRFYLDAPPPPCPVTIIHGRSDAVVAIEGSRSYAGRYPDQVHLIEVDAGHDLNGHLERIWHEVQENML